MFRRLVIAFASLNRLLPVPTHADPGDEHFPDVTLKSLQRKMPRAWGPKRSASRLQSAYCQRFNDTPVLVTNRAPQSARQIASPSGSPLVHPLLLYKSVKPSKRCFAMALILFNDPWHRMQIAVMASGDEIRGTSPSSPVYCSLTDNPVRG